MAPRLVIRHVELPADTQRIACVADTHSAPHERTADLLRAIAPVYAVRGNIDTRAASLPDVLVLSIGELRVLVIHIAVYGPRLRADAAKLAREHGAKLVVCGHSHVPFVGVDRGITVFNPGSIGPRRFTLPILLGKMELAGGRVRLGHVDAETGRAWTPP